MQFVSGASVRVYFRGKFQGQAAPGGTVSVSDASNKQQFDNYCPPLVLCAMNNNASVSLTFFCGAEYKRSLDFLSSLVLEFASLHNAFVISPSAQSYTQQHDRIIAARLLDAQIITRAKDSKTTMHAHVQPHMFPHIIATATITHKESSKQNTMQR